MLSALVRFPLIFISGIFVPLENLPYWGKLIAPISPLTYTTDIIRYSLYKVRFYPSYLSMAAILAFSLGFFSLALKVHQRNLAKGI